MKLVVLINYKLVIMTNILTIKQIILINGSTKNLYGSKEELKFQQLFTLYLT